MVDYRNHSIKFLWIPPKEESHSIIHEPLACSKCVSKSLDHSAIIQLHPESWKFSLVDSMRAAYCTMTVRAAVRPWQIGNRSIVESQPGGGQTRTPGERGAIMKHARGAVQKHRLTRTARTPWNQALGKVMTLNVSSNSCVAWSQSPSVQNTTTAAVAAAQKLRSKKSVGIFFFM